MLDYCLGLADDLNNTNRISLSFRFGKEMKEAPKTEPSGDTAQKQKARRKTWPGGSIIDGFIPPDKIAVLPIDNLTNERAGPSMARALVKTSLLKKGYVLADDSETDKILALKFSIINGGQLRSATAQQIGRALGADALVYGEISRLAVTPAADRLKRAAEIKFALVRTSDGETLFTNTMKFEDKIKRTPGEELPVPWSAEQEESAPTPARLLRPIAASAVYKCLRPLPPESSGMKNFESPVPDETGPDERCSV